MIVQSSESTADERHLALCDVPKLSAAIGPPINCKTVAIITPTTTWLRGANPPPNCLLAASFSATGVIIIRFDILTHKDVQLFSNALLKMLDSELRLKAEQDATPLPNGEVEEVSILSVGALRNSTILQPGWREAVDFNFQLSSDKSKVHVLGIAFVMVCRQALGNVTQYHGLDDAQRATYAAVLDSLVENAITSACKYYVKRDAKTISCK